MPIRIARAGSGVGSFRARREAAFTMVEIALCLGVIAIALVAIMGVMPTGLQVQRGNREDTILNQDGRFFLEAIRSGARGSDHLTNFVLSITLSNNRGAVLIHTNAGRGRVQSGHLNTLTNGRTIVGLLSTPRYLVGSNTVVTNYVTALVRSASGTAEERSDQWRDPDVGGDPIPFAFNYYMTAELAPFNPLPPLLTNYQRPGLTGAEVVTYSNNFLRVQNAAANFSELRLTLQGPVFMKGRTLDVAGRPKTFRTLVSGRPVLVEGNQPLVQVIQPDTFVRVTP
jgi:type II secretory pathway pseudopilin PulG